ncbi:hypothetical protein [Cohnella cellulosilytica]|uniref:Alpha-L-rhamnosidase six-hairpin glycosidase domain-containing protein n=1 Tax=Cohnella cellulosilytica TaxID=986710 RepID=A0ABW2FJD4_9BACL
MTKSSVSFAAARPVWPAGREREMNLTVGFRAVVGAAGGKRARLRLAASTLYRCYVNGRFVAHGPARGPHGYYRVDEWDLSGLLTEPLNVVAIEVNGANINSYYTLDQPSFLQAEVVVGEEIAAMTSAAGGAAAFEARILPQRVQRIQRYMYQRTFAEYYRMDAGAQRWRLAADKTEEVAACAETEPKRLLERGVNPSRFELRIPVRLLSEGRMQRNASAKRRRLGALLEIGQELRGYPEDELEVGMSDELQAWEAAERRETGVPYEADRPIGLTGGEYRTFDMGLNLTGFPGVRASCAERTKLVLLFDEILAPNGEPDPLRSGSVNAIVYELEPGEYELESMEPYTFRYLTLAAFEGAVRIEGTGLRELGNPDVDDAIFRSASRELNVIFEAARETFKQNVTDIYMDCPSRERAGWLCDSYFTARVEYWLTGEAAVERNFIENFRLPDSFPGVEEGMLPMCYPADIDWTPHGNIPNWGFWLVLELEEYARQRNGDRTLVREMEPRIRDYLNYFERFENEFGLLEKLEGWVFVEWSKANDFVQDVNFPINMLYAGALDAAGRLYGERIWLDKAARLRPAIRQLALAGRFFTDNAVRKDGCLVPTGETTEVCQYYAFYFGVASPDTDAELWRTLLEEFGPERDAAVSHSSVYPANAFIGNYLRLDLLSRYGEVERLLREIESYFLYMAERTGTLWEHKDTSASLNHGFASHVIQWLYRDVLGLREVEHDRRRVVAEVGSCGLEICSGTIPAAGGDIRLSWRREGDTVFCEFEGPADYVLEARAAPGLRLELATGRDGVR